jgi:uncharacterized protein (TIGR01319 family)
VPGVACVDVGSTFTKGLLVDVPSGEVLGAASTPTTSATDVLTGVGTVLDALGRPSTVHACSSAGGGLRLAVVGQERRVTAEAGARVGLSAGARVVHVASGVLDRAGLAALRDARPDVVLLVGGTDGGNPAVLLANADRLGRSALRVPVVVAGNVAVRDEVVARLSARPRPVVAVANVLPTIGELHPGPARAAIRQVFIRHVIGGKRLTRRPAVLAGLVRAATPDAVLAGVEVLAAERGHDVLVVDVGGATTDVYSVLDRDRQDARADLDAVEPLWHARSVEGDLGMRWNAPGIVAAAMAERLLPAGEEALADGAARRAAEPGWVPDSPADWDEDLTLARLAVTVAVRRHARDGPRDLRHVGLVVGSGGVVRHADPGRWAEVLAPCRTDYAGGWSLPEASALAVDAEYVLAAAGLLALSGDTDAAARVALTAVHEVSQT